MDGPAKEILHYREALWKGYQDIVASKSMTLGTIIDVYREIKRSHDGIRPYQAEVVIKKKAGVLWWPKPFTRRQEVKVWWRRKWQNYLIS